MGDLLSFAIPSTSAGVEKVIVIVIGLTETYVQHASVRMMMTTHVAASMMNDTTPATCLANQNAAAAVPDTYLHACAGSIPSSYTLMGSHHFILGWPLVLLHACTLCKLKSATSNLSEQEPFKPLRASLRHTLRHSVNLFISAFIQLFTIQAKTHVLTGLLAYKLLCVDFARNCC